MTSGELQFHAGSLEPRLGADALRDDWDPDWIEERFARILYQYWYLKAGLRDVPLRHDIDPADIAPVLPHIFLYQVHAGEPPDYSVRLIGEEMKRSVPNARPGISLESLHGTANWSQIREVYDHVVARRVPHYGQQSLYFHGHHYRDLRRILLPLAERDGRITRLIGTAVFTAARHLDPTPLSELQTGLTLVTGSPR